MTIARPTRRASPRRCPRRAGVGLKPEHFDAILAERPDVGFFEIHAENYMGDGGPPHRRLEAIRALYPLSLHGVGLSIGSPRPLDKRPSRRAWPRSIRRYEPGLFSEHLAWSSHDEGFLDDLLPLPYTEETLASVCAHIDETQEALGRRMLLENPSTYVRFAESDDPRDRVPRRDRAPHRLRAAARRQQCRGLRDQSRLRPPRLSRRFPARACRRDPSRRLCRGARTRPATPLLDRRPRFAGARPASGRSTSVSIGADRADADADRMGQRRSGLADAARRGAPRRRRGRQGRRRRQGSLAPCRLRRRSSAFARALVDPARAAARGDAAAARGGPTRGASPSIATMSRSA